MLWGEVICDVMGGENPQKSRALGFRLILDKVAETMNKILQLISV